MATLHWFYALILTAFLSQGDSIIPIPAPPTITRITTDSSGTSNDLTGSLGGGTILYVDGTGFLAGVSSTPTPPLTITIGTQPCGDVTPYSDTQLECVVPPPSPAAYGDRDIEVTITASYDGSPVTVPSAYNKFKYTVSKTAIIYAVGPAQQFVSTWETYAYISLYGDWKVAGQPLITVGSVATDIPTNPSGSGLEHIGVTLAVESNIAGDQALTVSLPSNYGNALFHWKAKQSTYKGASYYFKVLAQVSSISYNHGSSAGGLPITITGTGFPSDPTQIQVSIAGSNCPVTSSTYDTINCVTTPETIPPNNGGLYEGGVGLRHHVWLGQGIDKYITVQDSNADFFEIASLVESNPSLVAGSVGTGSFLERWVGFFKPPVAGSHTFYASTDDSCYVYISSSTTRGTFVPNIIINSGGMAYRDLVSSYRMNNYTVPFTMTQGGLYYIEIWHGQTTSGHFSLGVQLNAAPSPAATNFMPSLQELDVTPTMQPIKRVTQVVTIPFSGSISGTIFFTYNKNMPNAPTASLGSGSYPIKNNVSHCNSVISSFSTFQLPAPVKCTVKANSNSYEYTFSTSYPISLYTISADTTYVKVTSGTILRTYTATVIPGSTPVSGTFDLAWMSAPNNELKVVRNFPYNSAAYTIQSGLNSGFTMNNGLLVTGSPNSLYNPFTTSGAAIGDGGNYQFLFQNNQTIANNYKVPLLKVENPNPTGIYKQPYEQIVSSSNQFWWSVPSEFFRTIENFTTVQVSVKDQASPPSSIADFQLGLCQGRVDVTGNCAFSYLGANSPTITAADYAASAGSEMVLTGHNLPSTCDVITVTLGGANCPVVSCDTGSITVTQAIGAAGNEMPVVFIDGVGFAVIAPSVTPHFVSLTTTGTTIGNSGSGSGSSYLVTVTGKGFLPDPPLAGYTQTVTVELVGGAGGVPCVVQTSTGTEITCILASAPSTTVAQVSAIVTLNGPTVPANTAVNGPSFTFDPSSWPSITNINPGYASSIVKTIITITGQSLYPATVKVGEVICYVTSNTATQIICDLLGGPIGYVNLVVTTDVGAVSHNFGVLFEVDSLSPTTGSTAGGTLLTITGKGLSVVPKELYVFIGDYTHPCLIQQGTATSTSVQCVTPATDSALTVGPQSVVLVGRLSEIAICVPTDASCTFTYSSSVTPSITSIDIPTAPAGTTVTITGTGFSLGSVTTTVYFGTQSVPGIVSSPTTITAVVPNQEAGAHDVTVNFSDVGTAQGTIPFTQTLVVTSITPPSGSQAGAVVRITGSGFASSPTVKFGTKLCAQIIVSPPTPGVYVGSILCTLPSGTGVVSLSINQLTSAYPAPSTTALTFTYSSVLTPTVTAASISGTTVLITGTGFGTTVTVTVGGVDCTSPVVSNGNSITCTATLPAGSNTVVVYSANGLASGLVSITTSFTVAPTNGNGSFGGGATINLTGSGLGSSTQITVCGFPALQTTPAVIPPTFISPPLPSDHSQQTFAIVKTLTPITTGFTGTAAVGYPLSNLFDNNPATYFKSSQSPGTIFYNAGTSHHLLLSQIALLPAIGTYQSLVGTTVSISSDGTTWNQIYTFNVVSATWNYWIVPANVDGTDTAAPYIYPVYQAEYFKIVCPSTCTIAGLYFKGILTYIDTQPTLSCPIVAMDPTTATVVQVGTFIYEDAITPAITSISPAYGSSLGGTVITFVGLNLGTVSSVTIDGVACALVAPNTSTGFQCTSGVATTKSYPPSIVIATTGGPAVLGDGVNFIYADYWSLHSTWGGEVPPLEGESVHIPVGQVIILDVSPPELVLVLIEGTLIVNYGSDITLDASYVFINGGTFQVGTETTPFTNQFTLTLHGLLTTPQIPIFGNTVLVVYKGVLDLHGVKPAVTLTSLAASVSEGATSFTTRDATGWHVNDQILIASSSYAQTDSEVLTISSVSGLTITTSSGFQHKHYGATPASAGCTSIDMRAEVGLLTRNIKIVGATGGRSSQHGAHVMVNSPGDGSAIARIAYVEIVYGGQAYIADSAPINFYFSGNVQSSYVIGNSIHDSFSRGVEVHGSSYLRVENNVIYNIKGHGLTFINGIEIQNRIENNLLVSPIRSWGHFNTDINPVGLWITNPDNYITGNHVVGSRGSGIWFNFNSHPLGSTYYSKVNPSSVDLALFKNNVAHSNGRHGFELSPYHLPQNPAIYEGIVAYMNGLDGIYIARGGFVQVSNAKVADNKRAGIEWTYTIDAPGFGFVRISNALIIGNSGNNPTLDKDLAGNIGFYGPQSDGMTAGGLTFCSFVENTYPIGDESYSSSVGGHRIQIYGVTYDASVVSKKFYWGYPQRSYFEVLDESVTGVAEAYIAAYWPHLVFDTKCVQDSTFNGVVCDGTKIIRTVKIYNPSPAIASGVKLTLMRITSNSYPHTAAGPLVQRDNWINSAQSNSTWSSMLPAGGQWAVPVILTTEYFLHWGNTPIDWNAMDIDAASFDGSGYWVLLRFNFTDVREMFQVTSNKVTMYSSKLNSWPDVGPGFAGDSIFSNTTNMEFDIIMMPSLTPQFHVVGYSCYLSCPVAPPPLTIIPEQITSPWSSPATWPLGVLPVAGDSVHITTNMLITLDIVTPQLAYLLVDGFLTFATNQNVGLVADSIYVRSGIINSGTAATPLSPNNVQYINITGNFNSPSVLLSSTQVVNKALVVTGTLNLYGAPRTHWVHLRENAYKDDRIIFVDRVNWKVGDTIVITSTSFYQNETETTVIDALDGNIDLSTGAIIHNDLVGDQDWQNAHAKRNLGLYTTNQYPAGDYDILDTTTITKVTLHDALKYYHAGAGPKFYDQGALLDMRAEVGVLTSNLQINGLYNGWACDFVVGNAIDSTNVIISSGSVNLDSVSIDYCGQNSTERASLRFEGTTAPSTVNNIIITRSQTFAIHIVGSQSVTISNSLFLNAIRIGVLLESSNTITLNNNLMINVLQRLAVNIQYDKPTSYVICPGNYADCNTLTITNNVASGYGLLGFAYTGPTCADTSTKFTGNVAHTGSTGMITNACLKETSFTAYSNTETGVFVSTDDPKPTVSLLYLGENFNGLVVNIGNEADNGNEADINTIWLYARTEHSLCSSLACWHPACGDRRGILLGTNTKTAKVWSASGSLEDYLPLPLYGIDSNVAFNALFSFHNIYLYNFLPITDPATDCSTVITGIASNELLAQFHHYHQFSDLQWSNGQPDSIFNFPSANPDWVTQTLCGPNPCSGPSNVLVKDQDNTMLGQYSVQNSLSGDFMGGYLLSNNPGIASQGMCTQKPAGNGYNCTKTQIYHVPYDYGLLVFDNLDKSASAVTIAPIIVTSEDTYQNVNGQHFTNQLSEFYLNQLGEFYDVMNGAYTSSGRFATVIGVNRQFNITFTGTLPVHMRYSLQSYTSGSDGVFLTVNYSEAQVVQVSLNGTIVPPVGYNAHVTLASPSGANKWINVVNMIQFKVNAYDIVQLDIIDSIQLSVRMAMTVEDFFNNNGIGNFVDKLAACLGIPTWRIRVVDIKSGSTIVDSVIVPGDSTASSADQTTELEAINQLIITLANNGQLILNAAILDLTVGVVSSTPSNSTSNVTNTPVTLTPPSSTGTTGTTTTIPVTDGSSTLDWWAYFLIAIGCLLALVFIVVGVVVFTRLRKHKKLPVLPTSTGTTDLGLFSKIPATQNTEGTPRSGDGQGLSDAEQPLEAKLREDSPEKHTAQSVRW